MIEYVMMNAIGLITISLVAKVSGNWLALVFLLFTGIFKCLILYLYPKFIMPLFSTFTLLSESEDEKERKINEKIVELSNSVGFPAESKVVLEEADDGDLHSNASCSGCQIEINKMLLIHHDKHV